VPNPSNFLLTICVLIFVPTIKGIGVFACLVFLQAQTVREGARPIPPAVSQGHLTAGKIELLAPTGPFAIGTKIYNWVDDSRSEKVSKKPGEFRQLIVQVWYPTKNVAGPTAPYVPRLEAYRHVWEDADVEVAGRVLTHAHLNEKPLSGMQFPVVLFSHGWEGTRTEYTSMAEDLASHGYAFFGIDHPYMGRVALPDGQVTEATEDQFRSSAEIRDYYGRDVTFAIEQISRLNIADPDGTFSGRLGLSRIAAIGHSSGFVAASAACTTDPQIIACVNVDAPGFSANDLRGLSQPLLWVRLEKAGPVPAQFLTGRRAPVYELHLMGAKHGSVEDWDYLEAETFLKREAAADRLQELRKYIGAFLGKYLKDEKSGLLEQKPAQPAIRIKRYAPQ
jgi:pimeloyl-ACP methyl ester carboxylesterase